MSESLVSRLMRSSVDRAVRMQPRKAQRMADETLYASPTVRTDVEAIVTAGRRMVTSRLCPSAMGRVAVSRSKTSATISEEGADLGSLDNRHLTTVSTDDDIPVLAGLRAGAEAAVWGWPPSLLAATAAGGVDFPDWGELNAAAGRVVVVDGLDGTIDGVTVVRGRGVIATGPTPGDAVTSLEAAETLASIILATDPGRTNG